MLFVKHASKGLRPLWLCAQRLTLMLGTNPIVLFVCGLVQTQLCHLYVGWPWFPKDSLHWSCFFAADAVTFTVSGRIITALLVSMGVTKTRWWRHPMTDWNKFVKRVVQACDFSYFHEWLVRQRHAVDVTVERVIVWNVCSFCVIVLLLSAACLLDMQLYAVFFSFHRKRCQLSMNHVKDGTSHAHSGRCSFQASLNNRILVCEVSLLVCTWKLNSWDISMALHVYTPP